MSFSEQVRGTMSALHNGQFLFAPHKLHTCSVQSAPFNVYATYGNRPRSELVSDANVERCALRVLFQEVAG